MSETDDFLEKTLDEWSDKNILVPDMNEWPKAVEE
jgi:hypothetical protein